MQSDASWKELNLGDVIELKRGYDLPKGKRSVGEVPIVSSSGISDFHSESMVKGPGVVTGRYGTIGEVFYIDGDFWPLNTTLYVCDFKGSDPRFISYFLRTLDFQAYSDKGAVPGINRNHLHTAKIRIPTLPVQKAIARVLDALDSKIDLNRRTNQTLEAMAQAIFKSWFVDFDPVKAKIAAIDQGEDPQRAAMRAISGKTDAELDQMPNKHYDRLSATAALFPSAMEDSKLGVIPLGWKVVPASALIEFNPKEPLRKGTIAPYLDMASLPTSGSWAESPVPREFGSGMRFRNGDALLARITPCLENGKSAFVQNLPDESVGWGSTEFIVMRSKKPVPQEYAYLLARHAAFREHAIRSMTGTSGRQRAQADTVAEFKVISPSESSVWCAFSELLGSCFKAIKFHSEAGETLAELRETLLPKLLFGELSVANFESMR
ncbi:restriction endonuclease subunit S [Pseudomonas aeruginosa]|uniref:restriction endonuclease subunit S n=1 Tax=Pseudomonadota TaxID=1224 RepID=UPI0012A9AD07|nr:MULTISPECIES: restriction endonuclease subunit S [Pseudomonadota]MBP8322269.1 restriction endonuclease subunit S [Pseudomonas aeruginosa]CUR69349.1 putative nucleotidyltransferases [Achromobacter xylosoxidans]